MFPLPSIVLLGLLLVVALAGASACTSYVPREYLPPPLTDEKFDDPVKVVTVPLPVISTSPNEGPTYGALGAFLLSDKKDEISTMLVPQVNYNKNFGETTSVYGAIYSSPEQSWEFNLSQSTEINDDYEIKYRDKNFLGKRFDVSAFVYNFADGSGRFYGFHPNSAKEDETNYTDNERGVTLSGGYKVMQDVELVLGERFRDVSVDRGAVSSVPDITSRYNTGSVPGVDGFTTHAQKVSMVYSTLDSENLPTTGLYARTGAEGAFEGLGNPTDFGHLDVEVKDFYPLANDRFITASRLAYNQTMGHNVPFLERSILGGETTLRGYGRNRFVGNMYVLGNLEERIRLFRWEIFDVDADWEVAPFMDVGAVMQSVEKTTLRNLEYNPGIGFRAVVRPNIVGRVDIGVGREGTAIFAGLGYPF